MESTRGFEKNDNILFYFRKRRIILLLVVVVGLLLFTFRPQRTTDLVVKFL